MENDWIESALCKKSNRPDLWFSYDKKDIIKAKEICSQCSVRIPCFLSSWSSGECYGVRGGISEFEYLNYTWKEVTSERQNNRTRSNTVLKRILQRIK